tara:strand:- start:440 stop:817 length:378 start_codon:yes stop_codon:yes gene_type:complete
MSDDIDFGFTAVDEEELRSIAPSPASEEVSEKLDSTGEGLKLLEYKMDSVVEKLGSMLDEVETVKEYYNNEKVSVSSKLEEVEKLILPLLDNLKKNKEKEYIYWPNREAIINQQIERITNITRVG